jgi:hypothetical protein
MSGMKEVYKQEQISQKTISFQTMIQKYINFSTHALMQ